MWLVEFFLGQKMIKKESLDFSESNKYKFMFVQEKNPGHTRPQNIG
jgi:hypothetical protein